jgi:hypothetical protein
MLRFRQKTQRGGNMTTRVLAIGTPTVPRTSAKYQDALVREAQMSLRLYLEGHIDQHWIRQDATVVIHLINAQSVDDARAILERLPLVAGGLMEFEYMPVGPLTSFAQLLPPE